jgi:hypothetical protein
MHQAKKGFSLSVKSFFSILKKYHFQFIPDMRSPGCYSCPGLAALTACRPAGQGL